MRLQVTGGGGGAFVWLLCCAGRAGLLLGRWQVEMLRFGLQVLKRVATARIMGLAGVRSSAFGAVLRGWSPLTRGW